MAPMARVLVYNVRQGKSRKLWAIRDPDEPIRG